MKEPLWHMLWRWLQDYPAVYLQPYNYEWDKTIQMYITLNMFTIPAHTVMGARGIFRLEYPGGYMWIGNYPYSYGSTEKYTARVSRKTAKLLMDYATDLVLGEPDAETYSFADKTTQAMFMKKLKRRRQK